MSLILLITLIMKKNQYIDEKSQPQEDVVASSLSKKQKQKQWCESILIKLKKT